MVLLLEYFLPFFRDLYLENNRKWKLLFTFKFILLNLKNILNY